MGLRLGVEIHGSFVNNDTVPFGATADQGLCRLQVQTEVCGLRIADADPQQLLHPRTESKRIFYSEIEMLRSQ